MNDTSVIRAALEHSVFIGRHADLPWFTSISQDALRALSELENGEIVVNVGDKKDERHTGPPRAATVTACTWPPPEDGCDS